jgi:hypothetical protein
LDVDMVTGGSQTIEPALGNFFGYEHARHPSIVADATHRCQPVQRYRVGTSFTFRQDTAR